MLEGGRKSENIGLSMGVTIGDDAGKIDKNTHLLMIMCVRQLHIIGLHNLKNWSQLKRVNG